MAVYVDVEEGKPNEGRPPLEHAQRTCVKPAYAQGLLDRDARGVIEYRITMSRQGFFAAPPEECAKGAWSRIEF